MKDLHCSSQQYLLKFWRGRNCGIPEFHPGNENEISAGVNFEGYEPLHITEPPKTFLFNAANIMANEVETFEDGFNTEKAGDKAACSHIPSHHRDTQLWTAVSWAARLPRQPREKQPPGLLFPPGPPSHLGARGNAHVPPALWKEQAQGICECYTRTGWGVWASILNVSKPLIGK